MLPTSPGLFPEPVAAFLTLRAAAPNPFRQGTDLGFSLPRASVVRLDVYDVAGRRVARPVDGLHLPAGAHRVAWDGRNGQGAPVASGVYFLRLEAAGETRQGRVVRLR
jgi:flagellar hook assembly protein FlgD